MPLQCPTQNHNLGFVALAAKAAHAQLTSVAWSGKDVFSNHARATARALIEAAVAFRNTHGAPSVHYLEHEATRDDEGFGCDWHPSRITQARIAKELVAALSKNLGW